MPEQLIIFRRRWKKGRCPVPFFEGIHLPLPLWMHLHERAKLRRERIEKRPGFEVMPLRIESNKG